MGRHRRPVCAGLWHHVMNRGVERRSVFGSDRDREVFLGLLAECHERFAVETHAYVLMGNHYHLLVRDAEGRLPRALQLIESVHARRFNRRWERDGALFRGRYLGKVIQDDEQILITVRYIHRNPVRAGITALAAEYAWSSHCPYLSPSSPPWLCTSRVLGLLGTDADAAKAALQRLVDGDERPSEADASWDMFASRAERARADSACATASSRRTVQRLDPPDPDEVVTAAASSFGVGARRVLSGGWAASPARRVAMLVCNDATGATAAELARLFGVSPASFRVLVYRARRDAALDAGFAEDVARVRTALLRSHPTCGLP